MPTPKNCPEIQLTQRVRAGDVAVVVDRRNVVFDTLDGSRVASSVASRAVHSAAYALSSAEAFMWAEIDGASESVHEVTLILARSLVTRGIESSVSHVEDIVDEGDRVEQPSH